MKMLPELPINQTAKTLTMKKILLLTLLFVAGISISARVRYTPEMEGFLGTWEYQDGVKNDYRYRISVSDGWVVIQYKFTDNFNGPNSPSDRKVNIDYTYNDGVFSFQDNHSSCDAYNDVTLKLHEGSIVETIHHRSPGTNRTWQCVYEKSF